jgi:FAD:protein FMN transferase
MNVPRGAWVEQVMGMPVSVHLRGATLPRWRPAFLGEVFGELHRIDALLSTYRPDSQISRRRRRAHPHRMRPARG